MRLVLGAGSVGIYLAIIAFSYTTVSVGDVIGTAVLLIGSYIFAVMALFVSEEFGAFANRARWRLNTAAAVGLFILTAVIGFWEYKNLPIPPPTLGDIDKAIAKRTDPFSEGTGELRLPEEKVVLSSRSKILRRSIQIGKHGAIINYDGPSGSSLLSVFGGSDLTIESIDGKLAVSTTILNTRGEVVAELIRNEWKVAPPPETWDRNYNDSSLEVRGVQGAVVLQVQLLPDRIEMQGEWWGTDGRGIRLVEDVDPLHPGSFFIPLSINRLPEYPEILPMFRYPSSSHLGELVN